MTDPIAAARQMADAYDRESVITARISQAFATFASRMEAEAAAEEESLDEALAAALDEDEEGSES